MIRLLIRALIFLVSAALGLLVGAWVLDGDFVLSASGFVVAVLVFTVAQSVLSPFIAKTTARFAPSFLGGIGLVSTLVALGLATLISDGLEISGATGWILGTVIVWLVTALGTLVLPMIFLKERASDRGRATGI